MLENKEQMTSVWDGREGLTDSLDRDYAAMKGDGWDLIWEPTSALTTPWDEIIRRKGEAVDSEVFVTTEMERPRGRRRRARRALKDWADEYGGNMVQSGGRWTSGGHWRIKHRTVRARR